MPDQTEMTDEMALAALKNFADMHWVDGCVRLDGWFSPDELRAILHFAPKE
jgi:hypothetical protein